MRMQSKIILMMSVGFLFALISWMSLGLMLAMALLACAEHRGQSLAVREARGLSCDHDDGVEAARHRVDAIAAARSRRRQRCDCVLSDTPRRPRRSPNSTKNGPRPRPTETSRIEVKAPYGTPRAHLVDERLRLREVDLGQGLLLADPLGVGLAGGFIFGYFIALALRLRRRDLEPLEHLIRLLRRDGQFFIFLREYEFHVLDIFPTLFQFF